MIKKLLCDGDISEVKKEESFNKIIKVLEESKKEHIVAVYYPGLYSNDKALVLYSTVRNDGSLFVEGFEQIK